MYKSFKLIFALVLFCAPLLAGGQELHQDIQGVWRAEVMRVVSEETVTVPGTDVVSNVQTIEVRILEGEREGETVTFENDFILLEEGDTFFMNYLVTVQGDELYSVREVDRRAPMFFFIGLFALVVLFFGGKQGLRSLLALAGSLLVITYVLIPTLVSGLPPVPTSISVGALVLFFAIFFTHGFNKRSLIAFGGTVIAVVLTGILASVAVSATGLTGFSSEESVYLNLSTGGELNFVGLLLAAIIIGSLGVLDDIAVTQVAVVRELFATDKTLSWRKVYARAIRVGREHVGALVNTLVLAYTGAALPLLLLFSLSDVGAFAIINREIFASEIIRTIVGSIGLVLTVPITTVLAAVILEKDKAHLDADATGHAHLH